MSKSVTAIVKNNHTSTLVINGVTIAPSSEATVENFDPEHKVLKRWLDKKVISATKADAKK